MTSLTMENQFTNEAIALKPLCVEMANLTGSLELEREIDPCFSFISHVHLCGSMSHHCLTLPLIMSVNH